MARGRNLRGGRNRTSTECANAQRTIQTISTRQKTADNIYIYIYKEVWSLSSNEPTQIQLQPARWKEPNVNRAQESSRVGTKSPQSHCHTNPEMDRHTVNSRQQLLQLLQPTVHQSQLTQTQLVLSVYCRTQSQSRTTRNLTQSRQCTAGRNHNQRQST